MSSVATASAHSLAVSLQQFPDDTPAAMVEGELYTLGDLATLIGMRSARYRPYVSVIYSAGDLELQAQLAPIYVALAAEARDRGIELTQGEHDRLEQDVRTFARRFLFRREVTTKLEQPTLSALRALYEENKDDRLRTPERFLIRRITIPVSDETEAAIATARLEKLREEFLAGGDMIRLLREAELQSPTRVYYPDQDPGSMLGEELRAIEDEDALPVRRIDDSIELVIRHLRIAPGSIPFESSIDYLSGILLDQQATSLSSRYFTRIAEEPGLVRVIVENLQSRGEFALDSDVILLVGDRRIHRRDLQSAIGWRMELAATRDPEELRQLTLTSGVMQDALLDHVIDRDDLIDHPAVSTYRRDLMETLLTRKLLEPKARTLASPVSDEDALHHWRRKEAILGRNHGRVRFDQLSFTPNAPDIDEWERRLRGVETAAGFSNLARDAMRQHAASTMMSGLQDHIDAMPPEVRRVAEQSTLPTIAIPPRDPSEPLLAFWIVDAVADKRPPSAQLEIERAVVREERHQEIIEQLLVERAAAIEVESLLPLR